MTNVSDIVPGIISNQINDSNNVLFKAVDGRVDLPLINGSKAVNTGTDDSSLIINKGVLQTQDSIGRWMTYIMADCTNPVVADDPNMESLISTGQDLSTFMNQTKPSMLIEHRDLTCPEQIFTITDVSPASATSVEETKVFSFLVFMPLCVFVQYLFKLTCSSSIEELVCLLTKTRCFAKEEK